MDLGEGDATRLRARSGDRRSVSRLAREVRAAFDGWVRMESCVVEHSRRARGEDDPSQGFERIREVGTPEESPDLPPGFIWRKVLAVDGVGDLWFWFGIEQGTEEVRLLLFIPKARLMNPRRVHSAERSKVLSRWQWWEERASDGKGQ